MLETGSMGFLQINTKYCYLPEHKLTVLYLWQKITHISLTNSSIIPVLVITFSASGKGDTALQYNCHNCYLLKCTNLQYLNQTGHGERQRLGPTLCPGTGEAGARNPSLGARNPSLAAASPSCRDSTGCRLQQIKELETADSIHMECTAHLSYMQEKALMILNDARSSRVC